MSQDNIETMRNASMRREAIFLSFHSTGRSSGLSPT